MLPMQKRACWSSQKRHYVAPNAGTSLIPWGFDVCWTYWFIAIYVDMHGFRMHCSHAMLVYVETWLWPNKKRHLFLEIDVFLFLTPKKEGFCGSRYIYICVLFVHICPVTYPEKRPDDLPSFAGRKRADLGGGQLWWISHSNQSHVECHGERYDLVIFLRVLLMVMQVMHHF